MKGQLKKTKFVWAVIAALACSLYSCEKSVENTGEYVSFEGAEWPYGQTIVFNEAGDTLPGTVTSAQLAVKHTYEYPYANLWLELAYRSGDSIVADTFNIMLADRFGKWFGSGNGAITTVIDTVNLRHAVDPGSRFMLRHVMRAESIPEIEEIGFKLITDAQ